MELSRLETLMERSCTAEGMPDKSKVGLGRLDIALASTHHFFSLVGIQNHEYHDDRDHEHEHKLD